MDMQERFNTIKTGSNEDYTQLIASGELYKIPKKEMLTFLENSGLKVIERVLSSLLYLTDSDLAEIHRDRIYLYILEMSTHLTPSLTDRLIEWLKKDVTKLPAIVRFGWLENFTMDKIQLLFDEKSFNFINEFTKVFLDEIGWCLDTGTISEERYFAIFSKFKEINEDYITHIIDRIPEPKKTRLKQDAPDLYREMGIKEDMKKNIPKYIPPAAITENRGLDIEEMVRRRSNLKMMDWQEKGFTIEQEYENGDRVQVALSDYIDKNARKRIVNADEIVIKDEKITIYFDNANFHAEVENKGGFTRIDIFKYIYAGYRKILLNINPEMDLSLMSEEVLEYLIYDSELKVLFITIAH